MSVGVQLTVNDIQKVFGDILSSVSSRLLFRLLLDLTAGQISMLRRTLVFSERRNKLLQGCSVLKDFQGSLSHPANSQKKGKDECYSMEWIAHYGRCCSELHAYLYVCLCLWVHYSPLGPYLLTSPQHVRTLMICHHFWTWIRRFALAWPQGHVPMEELLHFGPPATWYTEVHTGTLNRLGYLHRHKDPMW